MHPIRPAATPAGVDNIDATLSRVRELADPTSFGRQLARQLSATPIGGDTPATGADPSTSNMSVVDVPTATLAQMLATLGAGSLGPPPVAASSLGSLVGPAGGSNRIAAALAPAPGLDLGIGPLARPLAAPLGSGYGQRVHPIHGDVRMHHGVDIGADEGTTIAAFAGGTVTFAGPRGGYGNLVIIDHGNGLTTRYAHQSSIDVTVGEVVASGQAVGRVGSTGTATGPHLHFELRRGGESIDPDAYLRG